MSRLKNRSRMLCAALDAVIAQAHGLRDYAAIDFEPESDEQARKQEEFDSSELVNNFDDAIELALAARNEWCAELEIEIEDGAVHWKKSELQRAVG